jgi:hypothetical protein
LSWHSCSLSRLHCVDNVLGSMIFCHDFILLSGLSAAYALRSRSSYMAGFLLLTQNEARHSTPAFLLNCPVSSIAITVAHAMSTSSVRGLISWGPRNPCTESSTCILPFFLIQRQQQTETAPLSSKLQEL